MNSNSLSLQSPTLQAIMEQRHLTRRGFLRGGMALAGSAALASTLKANTALAAVGGQAQGTSPLSFKEIAKQLSTTHALAEGYDLKVLISWGDPLHDAMPFDPNHVTAERQAQQFGYNNDYIAFMPLPKGSRSSTHGLLCVNHEYTNRSLMFTGLTRETEKDTISIPQARAEMEAQGTSVVEVKRGAKGWEVVAGSPYNRRITVTTPMRFAGAAAGHADLRTSADAEGMKPTGTMANCAGGTTPWGTVLTCEENFDYCFAGEAKPTHKAMYDRYQVGTESWYHWHHADVRFDVAKEPNEPNRFGWVVEYDPYDPTFIPVKRTALGRFKHECATTALCPDGRVAVYSGDDEPFEYLYRFVTARSYQPNNASANKDLLDEGELSVARFDADGTMEWLPLVYGTRGLTPENGFHSQGQVLIYARRAADFLGATPMDRPEDVEPNPVTGSVFVSLTKNADRVMTNAANPRPHNAYGHMLELLPPRNPKGAVDHSATTYRWEEFLRGGNPAVAADDAYYQHPPSQHGWLTNPDNVAFDSQGRIWICTDGQQSVIGKGDGVYAAQCQGKHKGATRLFFTVPMGAEVTGPAFTPDNTTLFLSVQHPAEGSSMDNPSTRWPQFQDGMPPRPSVVAITHAQGKVIGSA
jgi:uncharacterized protein